jgi:hypothetical protein
VTHSVNDAAGGVGQRWYEFRANTRELQAVSSSNRPDPGGRKVPLDGLYRHG